MFPPDGGEDGVDEVEDSGDVGKHLTETQKKNPTTFKDFNRKDIKMYFTLILQKYEALCAFVVYFGAFSVVREYIYGKLEKQNKL